MVIVGIVVVIFAVGMFITMWDSLRPIYGMGDVAAIVVIGCLCLLIALFGIDMMDGLDDPGEGGVPVESTR